MNNIQTARRLTHALTLLSLFAVTQLHAQESVIVAEGGSERTLQQSQKQRQQPPVSVAEGGGDRTRQHSDKQRQQQPVNVAEGGSDRLLKQTRPQREHDNAQA